MSKTKWITLLSTAVLVTAGGSGVLADEIVSDGTSVPDTSQVTPSPEPTTPATPAEPSNPAEPTTPTPVNPTTPEPVPTAPTQPTTPVEPETPISPVEPTTPGRTNQRIPSHQFQKGKRLLSQHNLLSPKRSLQALKFLKPLNRPPNKESHKKGRPQPLLVKSFKR